ncbi:hypothetical protein M3O96_17515 [Aquiflexum sp. TKW24L]|uniref:hypothetical protein n=1 Tax=Aquiflexum sp. TKW24L TaxID=2942212 RepID=UPI0020BF2C35|nr:hypothetical protein [Aquiflexum sp. TKW24L]MCL6260906.1 hypothetical protein [Aquiflexum sp. TKW24L]
MKKIPSFLLRALNAISRFDHLLNQKSKFIKIIAFLILPIGLFAFSCEDQDLKLDCIRGKYIGNYCEGAVIQILDDHKIARDWKSMFSDEVYTNSVVASIDTLIAKGLDPDFFSTDAVFYFKYREGGYGRKQFSICEPSAFVTITYISKNPCVNEN